MRAHLPRFLVAQPLSAGDTATLPAEEAKHARVRRLGVGDLVALFDGAGHSHIARLESLSRTAATVRVVETLPDRDAESALELTLAVGALKADRFEWVVEKATELGVARIQPFFSAYTVAQPSRTRAERWRHIAAAAAKQCGRSVVPEVSAPIDFAAVLALPASARVLFAEDGSGVDLGALALTSAASLVVVVGGEGGFSTDELAAARRAECRLIALGPRILRAETAAVAAVALCQARWGDLGSAGSTNN